MNKIRKEIVFVTTDGKFHIDLEKAEAHQKNVDSEHDEAQILQSLSNKIKQAAFEEEKSYYNNKKAELEDFGDPFIQGWDCTGKFNPISHCVHVPSKWDDGEQSCFYCGNPTKIYNQAEESKVEKALKKYLDNMTPEQEEAAKKFFEGPDIPGGWVSIEEHLPAWKASDLMLGYSLYEVKYANGSRSETMVSDHRQWYYEAKQLGITHWWNPVFKIKDHES